MASATISQLYASPSDSVMGGELADDTPAGISVEVTNTGSESLDAVTVHFSMSGASWSQGLSIASGGSGWAQWNVGELAAGQYQCEVSVAADVDQTTEHLATESVSFHVAQAGPAAPGPDTGGGSGDGDAAAPAPIASITQLYAARGDSVMGGEITAEAPVHIWVEVSNIGFVELDDVVVSFSMNGQSHEVRLDVGSSSGWAQWDVGTMSPGQYSCDVAVGANVESGSVALDQRSTDFWVHEPETVDDPYDDEPVGPPLAPTQVEIVSFAVVSANSLAPNGEAFTGDQLNISVGLRNVGESATGLINVSAAAGSEWETQEVTLGHGEERAFSFTGVAAEAGPLTVAAAVTGDIDGTTTGYLAQQTAEIQVSTPPDGTSGDYATVDASFHVLQTSEAGDQSVMPMYESHFSFTGLDGAAANVDQVPTCREVNQLVTCNNIMVPMVGTIQVTGQHEGDLVYGSLAYDLGANPDRTLQITATQRTSTATFRARSKTSLQEQANSTIRGGVKWKVIDIGGNHAWGDIESEEWEDEMEVTLIFVGNTLELSMQ